MKLKFTRILSLVFVGLCSFATAQKQVLPVVEQTVFKKDTLNIKDFGAVADGITLNSKSINAAIDACNQKGGGVVKVPKGLWITGPIVLKSNVNLYVERGALLQFTTDFDQYPLIESNWEGLAAYRCQSPISAKDQDNIAITGAGIIDGAGDAWRMVKKEKLTSSQWSKLIKSGGVLNDKQNIWYPSQKSFEGSKTPNPGSIVKGATLADAEKIKDFFRPNMVSLTSCKKVLLEGVTFQNSPAWNIHPLLCEHLTVRNVYAKNPWYAQNGDGIDLESVRYALIEKSTFDVGDDGICIKSGRDEEGRKRGVPTENVIVRNCTVYHAHGGFVIGSEMSGGVKNMWVENCTFIGTDIGLRFKTTRGRGGVVENININNISMVDIPGEAILFDMYYEAKDPIPLNGEQATAPAVEFKPVTDATPVFRNFNINNVVCNGAEKAIFVRGIPEMHVKDVNMSNITISAKKGVDIQEASGIKFTNLRLNVAENNPLISVLNSDNITFTGLKSDKAPELLISVQGDRTQKVQITKSDLSNVKTKSQFKFGATEGALSIK